LGSENFKAPYISKEDIWSNADAFREEYSDGVPPIDIHAIIEFDLELAIRPVAGLKEGSDIDALLLGERDGIVVDEREYMDDRYQNRIRFSLAHEVGHFVLHESVFADVNYDSVDEWVKFVGNLPEREWRFLEGQAHEFAGRLLVPRPNLEAELEKAFNVLKTNGLSPSQPGVQGYVAESMTSVFGTSGEVLKRRFSKEGLWPEG